MSLSVLLAIQKSKTAIYKDADESKKLAYPKDI